ncbi:hypothetical protein P167DRAFT_534455 [Morchella conica CCBAS932]|uniref:Uncharacterized protein n=1 Tax=Morchella conica CCBAS932 TaxID=1392247 RepID=A0A3N4L0Y3_9PEZI|nr:hypothetical protein P167DRAFT_534455 [Morchella conica CCBAS932]
MRTRNISKVGFVSETNLLVSKILRVFLKGCRCLLLLVFLLFSLSEGPGTVVHGVLTGTGC